MQHVLARGVTALDFAEWTDARLDGVEVSADLRSRLATGCLHVVLEHHRAILLLIENRMFGSALALVRSVFEAYVRGVWLAQCASDAQLQQFTQYKLNRTFQQLIDAIEQKPGFEAATFSAVKKRSWDSMNGFTHTGFDQVVRRNTAEAIEAAYDEEEVLAAISFSTAMRALAAVQIADLASDIELASQIRDRLVRDYGGDLAEPG